jgi:DNA helicase-2/ATP-dependent DNA helicase PcrA
MDKKVIFAVAGSGKTTHILNQISLDKRSLIITYTNNNIRNLKDGIIEKFGYFPENITLLPYFTFLYSFCFKPFLSYKYKTKGINYNPNLNRFIKQTNIKYYIDNYRRVYSNRISKLLEKTGELRNVNSRLEKYFDELFIDEIQDFGGNDFNFIKSIASANINILFVGDFYQHTFDTSRDGSVNRTIHNEYDRYKGLFGNMSINVDTDSLDKSYRCSPSVCKFITDNLKIDINSHKTDDTEVKLIENEEAAIKLYYDKKIVKLFYKEHYKFNCFSRNWGDSKGENHYQDICVVLNKTTMREFRKSNLENLTPQTKNKLYVACSRANNNLYFIDEEFYKKFKT